MDILVLYDIARKQNIEVIQFPMCENGSVSTMLPGGACYIGMDKSIQDGSANERTHLSHELGHCLTGSFYNRYSDFDIRQRHENKADKWAIEQLVSEDALDEAVASGYTEIWELADRFGVTEDFMRKAVCYHVHGNLATELYF